MKFFNIFLISILLISCSKKYTGEVSFKNCKINYPLHDEKKESRIYNGHNIPNQWEYESAMRKMALCLCEKYLQKPDTEIKEKIIEIYKYKFEFYNKENTFKKVNFDSILVNRKDIFNSEILID
ncbi:hypothetical protein SAMN05421841_0976 [Chryseobacterium wanjuense]|uniref:Lipoprotein n=1 Tax=Chryseobacterium wanjuense TaxID=356305 RepID=A0A1I0P428_9FLAO|nr:hypothetical protein [Chryseobacterium wanjuense]SEW08951.1 hypothetical protein SAMN05421841_0976 [Chryseobacterium wanjuense]